MLNQTIVSPTIPLRVEMIKNRRIMHWAIRSSARSFARTTHSFACSVLLASLARSAALIRSLPRSFTRSRAHGKEVSVHELNASISYSCYSVLINSPILLDSGVSVGRD